MAMLALMALVAACQSLPPVVPGALWAGRLAVQVEGDAQRSFSASFELQGSRQAGRMLLTGPLGNQIGQAQWSAGRVELLTSDGTRRYPDMDALTDDLLGEAVPVLALFDWLAGQPASDASHQSSSDEAAPGFDQYGWAVSLARQPQGLIVATRAQPAPRVTVRVKLDQP